MAMIKRSGTQPLTKEQVMKPIKRKTTKSLLVGQPKRKKKRK